MAFTTHAWLSPHVSADMQTTQNPHHFLSFFFARQPFYTPIDPSAACVLLLPLSRSFFPCFDPSNRRPKTRRHLCSHSHNKSLVTPNPIWFLRLLFSLTPCFFCVHMGKND